LATGAGSQLAGAARRVARSGRRLLRAGQYRAGVASRTLLHQWHKSLQLRVVGTTLVVSIAVIAVLGVFLVQQIATGLLASERTLALNQTAGGLAAAQADTTIQGLPNSSSTSAALISLASSLQARSAPGNSYFVVIKQRNSDSALIGVRADEVQPQSIPAGLVKDVTTEQDKGRNDRLYYVPATLVRADGSRQPALAVGAPITDHDQLYYLFPLTGQQQALQLVETTLFGAGAGLVVLLAVIVSLVTRWVIVPIRQAAQAASRLSAGNLDERMPARGTDDLAALAKSFNEMAASLQDKLAELQELSKVQRQFVSDVSHELRTPLTTIRIAADVLFGSKDELEPSPRRSAELLQSQLERFEALLADLLEISRHDANVATLDAESADVCDLVLRAAADAEQLAARRGTRIDFQLPPEPCIAEVDRRRVERVLRNLLDNAVEHGEGRDVVVTVAADRDAVAVAVRDHGCGFGPGEHQFVFDRFWRADPARARTTGGTGLGLAIALEDTRLHSGWLQAWGERGRGSVFRLTLPRSVGGKLAGSPLPLSPEEAEVAPEAGVAVVAGEGPGAIPAVAGEGPGSGGDATVASFADSGRQGAAGDTDG
jgi:two-component system sensor histidine kinase MtrB